MAIIGAFPKWHRSTVEGGIHSICGCWGKLLKVVAFESRKVEKVKVRIFWAERTMSSNAAAYETTQCIWEMAPDLGRGRTR